MSQLKTRVSSALKDAMRQKDQTRLGTLRLINAAIKDREIAARGGGGEGPAEISDAEVTQILAKMVKQRQESVRAYEEGGRLELAEREQSEIAVVEEFLPKPLTEAETSAAIDAAIEKTGATGIRDMGKVMGELKSRHAGRMDFGAVGARVRARLS
ncbi:GatB/YqeY domain-containing protein [Roseicyclus sp. F158]|uniref:GatB/YqeY domain-containing protein n=1 Tax=Tropicimonas omnivorans TaxID=3075590 RepID=A0ABU3DG05_9RHOB|nr:GatB/YqeY domain-containing protein [Roseicyclus sp. F158]MDT0682629.1 GatB/YqeY domain-containing protein [Roseicyclus sp. F158]